MTGSKKDLGIIARGELIGLNVRVTNAKNRCCNKTCGKVVDETKNMLIIQTKDDVKKITKKDCMFVFTKDKKEYTINGEDLTFRSEDRIKK